jgi:hypothetical protein
MELSAVVVYEVRFHRAFLVIVLKELLSGHFSEEITIDTLGLDAVNLKTG